MKQSAIHLQFNWNLKKTTTLNDREKQGLLTGLLNFRQNEGARTAYTILLSDLLSSSYKKELESILRKRFFGIELFIHYARHLVEFLIEIKEKNILSIEKEDLERGILAWGMGRLINL